MTQIQELYSLDDEVYFSEHVSAVLTIDGEKVYLVQSYDDYLTLKRQHTVTHKIGSMEPVGGLYRCDMPASDGSVLTIYLTPEDVIHNLQLAESQMQINRVEMIC